MAFSHLIINIVLRKYDNDLPTSRFSFLLPFHIYFAWGERQYSYIAIHCQGVGGSDSLHEVRRGGILHSWPSQVQAIPGPPKLYFRNSLNSKDIIIKFQNSESGWRFGLQNMQNVVLLILKSTKINILIFAS